MGNTTFDSPVANTIAVLLLSLIGYVLYDYYFNMLRLRRSLPPGPCPLPILGNHFLLPKSKPWFTFEEMSKTYNSPIVTFWLGRVPYIICNDAWTASDLMDKRADIYSSRPRFTGMGDLILSTTSNQTILPYGAQWRLHRKLTHSAVGQQSIGQIREVQADEAKILLRDLLDSPDEFSHAIERYACSIVALIGWGMRINSAQDYLCRKAVEFLESANFVIPGYLFETIPQLTYLPKWIFALPHQIKSGAAIGQDYFYRLCQEEGANNPTPNFAKTLIVEQKQLGLSNSEVANLTGVLIGGGVDTTSTALLSFMLAMCTHPEVQAKAQIELDEVVGQHRCPEYDDLKNLPYVSACVKETLRWRTVAALGGIPHSPIQDDVYKGYLIPKGAWIVGNSFAIHRNPREYPDPDVFKPERFLEEKQQPFPNGSGTTAFGWGRRACAGQALATQSLNSSIPAILWAFKVEPGLDADGNTLALDNDPQTGYTDTVNNRPKAFKARFTPRSDLVKQTLLHEAGIAREALKIYDRESHTRYDLSVKP